MLLALLLSLLVGFLIGTWLRMRLERPVRYIGALPASAPAPQPLHVLDPRATVLHPGHHEEQVG